MFQFQSWSHTWLKAGTRRTKKTELHTHIIYQRRKRRTSQCTPLAKSTAVCGFTVRVVFEVSFLRLQKNLGIFVFVEKVSLRSNLTWQTCSHPCRNVQIHTVWNHPNSNWIWTKFAFPYTLWLHLGLFFMNIYYISFVLKKKDVFFSHWAVL